MVAKKTNKVEIFIDWENIRRRIADNYVEKISIDKVIKAIKSATKEIGELRQATFYGDFTLRREEARSIEGKARFRIRNVLRSRSGKDQTDAVLITELMEAVFTPQDYNNILICSGDQGYCEAIRKALLKGMKVYVCAVGLDVSQDLTSLAPFYPIERYLDIQLTRKLPGQAQLTGLPAKELAHWSKFVSILDSIESKLDFVALTYFHKDIMLAYHLGGQTHDDRWACLETARESGILSIEQIDNPARPGFKMRIVKLNRENQLVKEILSRK